MKTSAIVPPLCFVGLLDWTTAQEIGQWILTHKTEIALKWVALALFGAVLWMVVMRFVGHPRDDE